MLQTDSHDYHVVAQGAMMVAGVPGLTCEIGLRAGGGSEFIMRALFASGQQDRTHIAIDPYGNIEYESHEGVVERLDYTNNMRNSCMVGIHTLAQQLNINFLFFPLEDTEFFNRYNDGVPVYQQVKKIYNEYAFVHFDGPHAWNPLVDEFKFFDQRAPKGAIHVYDDVSFYDHEKFEQEVILPSGWELVTKTLVKASYRKI